MHAKLDNILTCQQLLHKWWHDRLRKNWVCDMINSKLLSHKQLCSQE